MGNLDTVDNLQKEVAKSANSAQQKFDEAYGNSTEAKINKFKNSMQQLYMSMFNSQVINSAIADFTSVIQSLNTIVNSSENTKTAIVALTTAIVALGVAIKTNGIAELNKSLVSLIPNLFKSAQSGTILTTILGGLGKAFAFLISPVGLLSIALGAATIAMVKHINHQKELKQQADELKTSYDSLNKSIKDNDVNGMEGSTSDLKKKQDEYKELLKQRKELEDRFKDIGKSDMDDMEKTTAQNIISKQLSDTNKKIEEQANAWEEAGYTINKATGEVQQLNQAQTLLENNKIANTIREQSQAEIDNRNEIIKLIQEYQGLDAIESKNAIQKERLSQLSEILTSKIGGLVVSKDKEGNVTIKNTDLLDKEIKMLNTEGATVETLTAVKLEHAKNNAVIEIGKTKTTYAEVKKRIEFYKEEMKALNDLKGSNNQTYDELSEKWNKDPSSLTKDEKILFDNMQRGGVAMGVRDSTNLYNLQKYIDEIDKIYASETKEIGKTTDLLNNDYIPANEKATKSTKENTVAINDAKNSIRDYENALKSLDNTIYKLEADMSGMDDSSQTYRNALSQEIKLLEQKNKTLTDGIAIAKNNANVLSKMPKTTTSSSSSAKGGYSSADGFINAIMPYAQEAKEKYNVPISLLLAQAMSESTNGTSYLARTDNNYFGMTWTGKNGQKGSARPKAEGGNYVHYDSLQQSTEAYARLLSSYYGINGDSFDSGLQKVVNKGYAASPSYKQLVQSKYNQYNLGKYDTGTYKGVASSNSSSISSSNNVDTEIDSLASKIEDYQKQKIDIGKKIEELKIAILESDTKFYDNQIANIDSKITTSQANSDLYSDGSQQKTQYLTEQSKLINERYGVIAKKEQALNDAIKSGGYSEKVIADLKVQLADVKNEELSTIKELHDAFVNMWDSELMSKTKIYDDNISTLQSKIDKLNVADKDNYEEKIKLNQKIIEQEGLKKQKIEEQIKKFREMLLVEKYDSTKDLLSAKINELLKQVDEVVQAQNDAKNNAVEMAQSAMDLISTVESKIAEMIKKDVDKQKEAYDKDLDNFRSAIEEKKNLINNQYDEDNYNRQLADENQKKLDIQSKINTLSLDSSSEAKAQVIELRKQLAEQQRVIDDKVAQHSKDAQIKALDDKLNAQEKAVGNAKEKLDEQYDDEQINIMARQALVNGYYTNINGHIENLKVAYINFENEFGEGMTSMGEIIETEFIEKIEKAIDLIGQTPELNNIIKGSSSNNSSNSNPNTSSKAIYGSGADLQNAKTYLSGYGYEFVDVSDGEKYEAGKNDIIVGGSAVTKNVSNNGATRLAGNNRDLTKEEIINLVKKLEKEGKSYKNGGIIESDQIALLHGSNGNSSFEAVLNEPQLVNLTKSTILDTLKNVKLPSVLDNINLSQIKIPNLSSTNNASNVTLQFDKLINVEGNMDKGTVIDTQKIVNEVCTKLKTVINTNGGKRLLI